MADEHDEGVSLCDGSDHQGQNRQREIPNEGGSAVTSDWIDEPIARSADDRLGRLGYARHVASLISDTHRPEASVVYGLSGPWGSGKTSLSNLIVEQLVEQSSPWRIARFTPWSTNDVNGMLAEFYRSIAHALPHRKGAKKARQALSVVAQVAAPVAEAIPVAGAAASTLIKTGSDMLSASPPWDVAFQRATDRIRDLAVPVLVVVDDIDRLHTEELTTLLKVVRLLGRFPGVDYLLAYDNATVFRALAGTASSGDRADGTPEQFMEKIVQFPLAVPPLSIGQQLRLLNEGFARSLAATGRGDSDDGRLSSLRSSFVAMLRTPRAIERYAAQVQHQLTMLPSEEIDDIDLIILTLIRVALPSMFEGLPRYREELLNGHTGRMAPVQNRRSLDDHFEQFDVTELLGEVPPALRDAASELILSLFPKVMGPDRVTVTRGRSGRAVSVDAYFDRYFSMAIGDGDVSDVEVRRAVIAAGRADPAALEQLLSSDDPSRLLLTLGKVQAAAVRDTVDAAEMITVAGLLADRVADFPDPAHLVFSPQDLALSVMTDLLVRGRDRFTTDQVAALAARVQSTPVRLAFWSYIEAALRHERVEPAPAWVGTIRDRLADAAASDFLANLRAGDSAPTEDGIGRSLHFALEHGREDVLRGQVEQLWASGQIGLDTLAARLVSVRRLMSVGAPWRLAGEIDQEVYNRVSPAANDPFYEAAPLPFDQDDFSWANRRRAATGRTRRPPDRTSPRPDTTVDSPDGGRD